MDALLLVDLQNDFMPGGALAVPEGDQVLPIANDLITRFPLVLATADWHPANHCSFASNHPGREVGEIIPVGGLDQYLWPDHCIQNTPGAELHPGLDQTRIQHIIHKGADPLLDSYSGFFDNGHLQATGLEDYLKSQGARRLFILGLATDYCVKFTVLDAVRLGFETFVIENGCRGVNVQAGDDRQALEEMQQAGARLLTGDAPTDYIP